MSEAIAATANVIDDLPPYFGTTLHGQPVLSGNTNFVADGIIQYIRTLRGATTQGKTALKDEILMPRTSPAIAGFSKLSSALRQLLRAPVSDEFGPVRPTDASIERATNTLYPFVKLGFGFPEAVDVGTDHDGAVRIVWENGPRFLELVVPYEHNAPAYFYYSSGNQYNLQHDLALDAVRERFNWLGATS
jgi:hypothetical protein